MDKLINTFLTGYGDGYGNGDGYGYGDGYGNGDGDGNGYGDGYGDGYGNGDGNGNGNGYGNGDGYGNGYGNGYGIKLLNFKGLPVYYIDGIPCTFINIRGNCAKVNVVDINKFSSSIQYVCRFNDAFAHGLTVKKAMHDAERKYYASLDVEQSIEMFIEKFNKGVEYDNKELFK